MPKKNDCAVAGCTNKTKNLKNKFCDNCYQKKQNKDSVKNEEPLTNECLAAGCTNKTSNVNNKFCGLCYKQKKAEVSVKKEEPLTIKCLGCSGTITLPANFCFNCSARVPSQYSDQEKTSDPTIRRPPAEDVAAIQKEKIKLKELASMKQIYETSTGASSGQVSSSGGHPRVITSTVIDVNAVAGNVQVRKLEGSDGASNTMEVGNGGDGMIEYHNSESRKDYEKQNQILDDSSLLPDRGGTSPTSSRYQYSTHEYHTQNRIENPSVNTSHLNNGSGDSVMPPAKEGTAAERMPTTSAAHVFGNQNTAGSGPPVGHGFGPTQPVQNQTTPTSPVAHVFGNQNMPGSAPPVGHGFGPRQPVQNQTTPTSPVAPVFGNQNTAGSPPHVGHSQPVTHEVDEPQKHKRAKEFEKMQSSGSSEVESGASTPDGYNLRSRQHVQHHPLSSHQHGKEAFQEHGIPREVWQRSEGSAVDLNTFGGTSLQVQTQQNQPRLDLTGHNQNTPTQRGADSATAGTMSYAHAAGSHTNQSNLNDGRRGGEAYRKDDNYISSSTSAKTSAQQTQYKEPFVPPAFKDKKEDMMTVHFHAVLTPEFKFNLKTDKVYIRFGSYNFGRFEYNAVEMNPMNSQNNYVFMTGTLQVKPYYLKPRNNYIEYKYCHCRTERGKQDVYEYEFLFNQVGSSIINRALMTNRMNPNPGVIWRQYDGMIQHRNLTEIMKEGKKPESKSMFKRFIPDWAKKFFSSGTVSDRNERIATDRKVALLTYLPTWDGFVCENSTVMEPCQAIETLLQVAETMKGIWTKNQYLFEVKCWSPIGFVASEVLLQYLKAKITELGNGVAPKDVDTTVTKLISALAIVHVLTKASIFTPRDLRHTLLHALVLPLTLAKHQYARVVEIIKEAFKPILDDLIVSLEYWCNQAMAPHSDKDHDASWLLVVPLLHFLRNDSKPMEWPTKLDKHNYNDVAWWGHDNLNVRECKKHRKQTMEQIRDLLGDLQRLFQIDLLLQRTLLSSMSIMELAEIFFIAKFDFYVTCCSIGRMFRQIYDKGVDSKIQELQIIIRVVLDNIESNNKDKAKSLHYQPTDRDLKATPVVFESLKMCLKRPRHSENVTTIPFLLRFFAESVDRCVANTDEGKRMETWIEEVKSYVDEVGQLVKSLMKISLENVAYDKMLGFLDSLFTVAFTYADINQIWNNILYKGLQDFIQVKIKGYNEDERLVNFYCRYTDFNKFHPKIEAVFMEAAFGIIDKVMEGAAGEDFLHRVSSGSLPYEAIKYGKIFSYFLEKSLKHQDAMTLRYQLEWKPLAGFFKMTVSGKSSIALTENAQSLLCLVKSVMEEVTLDSILRGSITVKEFVLVRQQREQFFKLCDVMDVARVAKKFLPPHAEIKDATGLVQKVVRQREREFDEFHDFCIRVAVMQTMCREISYEDSSGKRKLAVDIEGIQNSLAIDRDGLELDKFCHPAEVHQIMTTRCLPKIMFFALSDGVVAMLPEIQQIHLSVIFRQFWTRTVRRVLQQRAEGERPMSLDDVEKLIWQNVKQEWQEFETSLITGAITLNSVRINLAPIDDDALEPQLKIFNTGMAVRNWIKQRSDQIRLYRQLGRCLETANTIQAIRETFQLEGDFSAIELLCSTTKKDFHSRCLNDLDSGVEVASRELEHVTKEQSESLKTLMKCKNLIIWIKNEIKNMQELKVFVDLAMIQAGETPIEVDRVTCLHQAATGYAAFIFDLKEYSGYTDLMHICKLTWKALSNDRQLSKKLNDISRHMEWLKGVKESHGSVETTSVRQVERINAGGIYKIGKLKECNLQLRVPAEDGEEKAYTVGQLKDLQSKLMLVAGGKSQRTTEAKAEIDRFVEVFDGAQDLETYYHKMCASGNVLFTDLKIVLKCDGSSKSPVHVDFCVVDQKPLFGKKELTELLRELLVFMKTSLKEWYDYIDEKREEFYFLNFYTTKQLVILRRALARFGQKDVSHDVYALLSLVRPNCSIHDLRRAVVEVAQEKESNDAMLEEEHDGEDVQMCDALPEEQPDKERLIAFWTDMEEMMIDEHQAMAVLEDQRMIDLEDAVAFVYDTPYPEEILEELVERFITRVGCGLSDLAHGNDDRESGKVEVAKVVEEKQEDQKPVSLKNEGRGTESVRNDLLKRMKTGTLIEKLNCLWTEYLCSTKSVDLSDYVSVETLGKLLKYLATSDFQSVPRSFPQLLIRGQPNLIVCPARDVLHTVLSVYMEGNGSLPAYDEVLLCNSATTLEEVVLLWRRALNGNNDKTYCLVNADALYYDVSVEAVNKLHQLMKGKADYKLVIVCNREREDKSYMVTALNTDRISSDKPTCRRRQDIQEYLRIQFIQQVPLTNQGIQPAARLTNQRTCVQAISSKRPGVGKSLLIQRHKERLQREGGQLNCCITVPLQTLTVKENDIAETLIGEMQRMNERFPRIIHLDVSPNVSGGLDNLLFNLLILNTICRPDGSVWRRQFYDLYLVEVTQAVEATTKDAKGEHLSSNETFFESLPRVLCQPPRVVQILEDEKSQGRLPDFHDPLMDDLEFRSSSFQRPYQYLAGLKRGANLDAMRFNRRTVYGNHADCLEMLLKHCGLVDPSWSELSHFARFLDKQLEACEGSNFCDPTMLSDTGLDGFKTFVVKFMLQMSKDFATPSLQMSDESYRVGDDQEAGQVNLQALQLRRHWESSPHPYIFFNDDHQTMTFMGFSIDRNGTLLDVDGRVLQQNVMTKPLMRGLELQRVNLSEDFNALPRDDKLRKLCMVMGTKYICNPDDTYELTTDNVKKILAIHMRFRCGIPVIVMGETGCGKTRLIRFMCQLQAGGLGIDAPVNNMILMKVHGGTSSEYIVERVRKAEQLARVNKARYQIDTILFFDEANTTEAIGIIKEIMCDGRMNGQLIDFNGSGLKIVAACNPYKRHTTEMIERLEAAGLGYHIKASNTKDRLGSIPLRQLVYRVQALPPSMLPLVWDFGQLNSAVEKMYIAQIVQRFVNNGQINAHPQQVQVVSEVLSAAQGFMRKQKNECSFVSLRDVERTLNVMVWFLNKQDLLRPMIKKKLMNDARKANGMEEIEEDEYEDDYDDDYEEYDIQEVDDLTWALVLALGVCYHACLDKKREEFRFTVARSFQDPLILYGGHRTMYREINSCQDIFLDEIQLGPNIAPNMALKENIFMMIICIELRIPLFLVGKPGSSKSLAKTIVADAMQGDSAASDLFKELKQVHMISYQCSPLSTPDGIVGTFRQCSRFQESKDLKKFVSVVVLDEVGLAEDSPRMPLKTLHPLLEYGSEEDDNPPAHKKVAFIGISNWALDPAKMNRGILVSRGVPDEAELIESAKGICASATSHNVSQILKPLAEGYLEIYQRQGRGQKGQDRQDDHKGHDFFGLRDFYSLIKMVNQFSKNSRREPTWAEVEHAIRRNFGGMARTEDHIKIFEKKLESYMRKEKCKTDPDCTPSGLIKASLDAQGQTRVEGTKKVGHGTSDGDSRYLLVLTEKFAALPILQEHLNKMKDAVIIYGSSFPFDQEYTQVCRNINRIKQCMETGQTVVLLNLENLYESLYDALNQYYVYFGGQRYVDLGLGTHRVKCRVHESFRLIVVADKDVVHERFPIPLINRLEKHFLAMTTMLTPEQLRVVKMLEDWVTMFTTIRQHAHLAKSAKDVFKKSDAFIGYHGDTVAALVYQSMSPSDDPDKVFEKVKDQLLIRATPESVTRLAKTNMTEHEREELTHTYFNVQKHGCLADYLGEQIENNRREERDKGILAQVTTYSRLLTKRDSQALAESTELDARDIKMISLQEFQHEQQFSIRVQKFFDATGGRERLLVVQCDASSDTSNLISCACYRVQDERENPLSAIQERRQAAQGGGTDQMYQNGNRAHVVFIIQLPRVNRCFEGFQGGEWSSAHIDDLQPPKENRPDVSKLIGRPMSELFKTSKEDYQQRQNEEEVVTPIREDDEESMEEDSDVTRMKKDYGMEYDSLEDYPEDMEREEAVNADVGEVLEYLVDATVDEMEQGSDASASDAATRNDVMAGDEEEMEQESNASEEVESNDAGDVDFTAVLLDCIHPATARIIDPTNQRHYSTERVCLLVDLLKGESCYLEFLRLLESLILKLMKEKEARALKASDWLMSEALGIKEVQESGTFRQACWQRLTATVAPFFAEVIAVCDVSNNLHLLKTERDDNAWLHRLWLNIFSSEDLMNISYDMCLSPEKEVQRSEVQVVEKGFGGKSFVATFPFSWIVKSKLDDIWKFASEVKVGAEVSSERQFLRNVQGSEIGRFLQTAINAGGCQKVVQCYVSDFIRMTCKITQRDEHKLICEELINASYSTVRELGGRVKGVDSVAAVHLTFNRLQARFEHLSQLVELCPSVLKKIQESERSDTDEMSVDVTSLKFVLESIDDKDFRSQIGQRKWLNKIQMLCPVVQSMIGLKKKRSGGYGAKNQIILEECRCLWSRITVMKLFFEHVSLPNKEFADIVSPKCRALWLSLRKTADLKSDTSMNSLVNILNVINKKAGETYYKSGIHICGMCDESIQDPVLLPCKPDHHVFCMQCIKEYFKTEKANRCPTCTSEYPEDFECKEQSQVSEVIAKHNAFRQCCNSFFMEVVSQLCFADGTPPSEPVIKRLLGYVTIDSKKQHRRVTRNVSPFPEDCIDPNPVVRSFLLQLLLQSNLESVKEHVQDYLVNCKDLMEGSAANAVGICTLFINCLEDTYYSGFPQDCDANQVSKLLGDADEKLRNARGYLDRRRTVAGESLSVELLEAISQIRFVLTILIDVTQRPQLCSSVNIKRLVSMLVTGAKELCQQHKQAQLYLVKYICKAYGRDAVNQLKQDKQLDWILPEELKVEEQSIPDNFVILGEMYRNVREVVGQCMVDKDFEKMFKDVTNVIGREKEKETCLLLALFREITMNATARVEAKRITLEVKQQFGKVMQDMAFLRNKVVADSLLQNRAQNPQHVLTVTPGRSQLTYSIQAAVTHLQIVLNVVEKHSLTQCLAVMMRNPSQMQASYLPAMPQDDRMEAIQALRNSGKDGNLNWYECPNGHPYTIGECGKPYATGRCVECNLPIGGEQHRAHAGNKLMNQTVDTTSTGHVLGNPQNHGNQIVCERTMNCVATAVVRFLLHASMLLGTECQQGPQPIINIIKPAPVYVLDFLWQHLHNDVRLLSVATGKNTDDCMFVLHKVIDNILRKVTANLQLGFQQLLTSKNCRKTWEDNFTTAYIKPVLQGLDGMIDQSNKILIADKRLSNDPLMRLLHTANEPEDLDRLVETSHVWQYRSRITIQSIHQALSEEDGRALPVLTLFMEKEKHLRFVRCLPDIIRLQRLLINKYNRHIDSAEAINLSISKFLNQIHASEKDEFKNLIDTFIDAWNSLRQDVALTVKLPIPKECCSEPMTYESNIAMLLPTRRESGLCSTGLVDFLMFTQNDFLERYRSILQEQPSKFKVDPSDLLQSHLIAYDPDRDLLPLILSQCQYIVRPMAGNKVEYNLKGLELQLVERFVRGRAFIARTFDQLFFRQDIRNSAIFENLRAKIPQVELSTAVQSSIVTELKSYQELCKELALLDIAIGFLANYKPEGDMLIKDYLRNKLAMPQEKGLRSSTASQQCRLKHVLALWQVLAVEKAVRLNNNSQDPFDGIADDYRQDLSDALKDDLKAKLRYIKVDLLCAELYEYIVLNLGQRSTNANEDKTKWPISYTLQAYYESKYEDGEIPGLEQLPDTIQLSHAVSTWKTIAHFHNRQSVQG